jgi:hypothetical protein
MQQNLVYQKELYSHKFINQSLKGNANVFLNAHDVSDSKNEMFHYNIYIFI